MTTAPSSSPVVISTSYGRLRGSKSGETYAFRNIPFASPPVRFKRPEPPKSWTGVRDATRNGPLCAQPKPFPDDLKSFAREASRLALRAVTSSKPSIVAVPPPNVSEEHGLNLNVYTNAPDASAPVLVWFHGGAFMYGSGSQSIYQHRWGSYFTVKTGCVLVTTNYRLGAFGYLKVPGGDTNCGVRDQIAALRWVRDEIAAFGGDPSNVCIAGESAGGMSCGVLLASPLARPLFHSCICMSGAASNAMSIEDADGVYERFARGLPSDADVHDVPLRTILGAQQRLLFNEKMAMPYQPVVDGDVLLDVPLNVVLAGRAADKRLLVGFNREEWNLFAPSVPVLSRLFESSDPNDETLIKHVASLLSPQQMGSASSRSSATSKATDLVRTLRSRVGPSIRAKALRTRLYTELVFATPALLLAEAFSSHRPSDCFVYRYDYAGSIFGAAHAVELPLLFGTHTQHVALQWFSGARGAVARRLSLDLIESFGRFVRFGSPGERWPCFRSPSSDRRRVYVFDRQCRVDTTVTTSGIIPELADELKRSVRPFGIRSFDARKSSRPRSML